MAPGNNEGVGARDANPPKDIPNNHSAIFVDLDESRKVYVTLQAQFALKGYTLSELTDSTLLICRWDRSIHCSDLAQVRAFYHRIGGAA